MDLQLRFSRVAFIVFVFQTDYYILGSRVITNGNFLFEFQEGHSGRDPDLEYLEIVRTIYCNKVPDHILLSMSTRCWEYIPINNITLSRPIASSIVLRLDFLRYYRVGCRARHRHSPFLIFIRFLIFSSPYLRVDMSQSIVKHRPVILLRGYLQVLVLCVQGLLVATGGTVRLQYTFLLESLQ